jgi:hypothetical protein
MNVTDQFYAPAALLPGKVLPEPRLGEPQIRSGRDGERKNPCPCQESDLSRPTRSHSLY